MANTYNTLNYRAQGGSTWVVDGELNIGGIVNFEAGAYQTQVVTEHTTEGSVLVPGGLNTFGKNSTGIVLNLPPPVAGMEITCYTSDGTSGKFNITSASSYLLIDITLGTATEEGTFSDENNSIRCSGPALVFKAVNSTQWMVINNDGVSAAGTSAAPSTVV